MNKNYYFNGLLLAVLLHCGLWQIAVGQQGTSPAAYSWENQLIPPSPEAGAFSKMDLAPTVTATGKAAAAVPLYTLATAGLKVPVQLAYTGGNGIRVNEVASNVGLGWVLDAGGVISVTVHGQADLVRDAYKGHRSFHPFLTHRNRIGYLSCDTASTKLSPEAVTAQYTYADNVASGLADSQPDEYNLKIPGTQTAFTLDSVGTCYTIPHNNLKILLKGNASSGYYFEALDVQGNRYLFDQRERSSTISIQNGSTVRPTNGGPYISAYYLSKITTPHGEEISFTYESLRYYQPLGTDLEVFHFNSCLDNETARPISNAYTVRRQSFNAPRLTSIQSQVGRVDFTYDAADRLDNPGTNRLAVVTVTNSTGKQIKHIQLTHNYFRSFDYSYYTDTATQYLHARLKLVSVRENTLPAYVFAYDSLIAVPARLSYSQDHFGYYNGRSNQNLIGDPDYEHRADRAADSLYCQFGLLKSIRYPTGGLQRFTYESPSLISVDAAKLVMLFREAGLYFWG